MTKSSSFELENIGQACHFAFGGCLSNFCKGFRNPLSTFSSKRKSLRKQQEV